MKNKDVFYLQHKLPWESEWDDVEKGISTDCEKFTKILEKEPLHLIETEYRIIIKKEIKLRNNKKEVKCPMCIMNGSQIASSLREQKQRNN